MNKIIWNLNAWNDYIYWQWQDRKTLKRINSLLQAIVRSPFEGIGKPEPLKGNFAGSWSRRIDDNNRIVYSVTEDYVLIISCRGHYD